MTLLFAGGTPAPTLSATPGAAHLRFGAQPAPAPRPLLVFSGGSPAPLLLAVPAAAAITFQGGVPQPLLRAQPGAAVVVLGAGAPVAGSVVLPAAPLVRQAEGVWLVEAWAALGEETGDWIPNGFEPNGPRTVGRLAILRYTDAGPGYATGPDDDPPHTLYDPCLIHPGYVERGLAVGASRPTLGEIRLASTGHLDGLIGLGLDGQRVRVRRGPLDGAYPEDFPVQLEATLNQAEFQAREVRLQLRDPTAVLDRPLLTSRYGGTNVPPNGVDGTPEDLKGRPKPLFWGRVFNVTPLLVNASKLIYQVNDGTCFDIPAVYDRGSALSRGLDYADLASMLSSAPAAGTYRAWQGGGYFRLGASPAGQVTCDAVRDGVPGQHSAAHVLGRIAVHMGLPVEALDATDQAALEQAAPYEVGVWVDGADTAVAVMDRVAASVGAWYGFDRRGFLRMGRLAAPAGAPVSELTEASIVSLERSAGQALPAWRVTVNYAINHTPQASDLAGSVSAERRAWLAASTRSVAAQRNSVLSLHKLAPDMTRDTALVWPADAQAETARLLGLHSVRRDTYQVAVRLASHEVATVDLGAVLRLTWPRYGLDLGRLFVVIGQRLDFLTMTARLTLWG